MHQQRKRCHNEHECENANSSKERAKSPKRISGILQPSLSRHSPSPTTRRVKLLGEFFRRSPAIEPPPASPIPAMLQCDGIRFAYGRNSQLTVWFWACVSPDATRCGKFRSSARPGSSALSVDMTYEKLLARSIGSLSDNRPHRFLLLLRSISRSLAPAPGIC